MITTDYARTMARYNRWMNGRLYDVCAAVSDAERRRDAGAFFKSIHGTLNHLLLADRIWMGRFTAQPFTAAKSLDQELYADFAELRTEREKEDARILAWTESLTDPALNRELVFTTLANPQERRLPLAFALMHFFNHQAHHRGQLTTLLSQLGIDYGPTDLLVMPAATSHGA